MNSGLTDCLIASLVPLFLLATSCASSGGDKTPKRYQSPKAVFDAYREARAKRDARTAFSVLTPQVQNDAVFETVFSCMERQGADAITGRRSEAEEIGRIVGKYFDSPAAENDYNKQYKKKHGTDLAKLRAKAEAELEKNPNAVQHELPRDDQLWRDVVAAHIKDKAGFYEAVAKHFDESAAKRHEEEPVNPLGDLEHLVVQGDSATGSAKETILPRVAAGQSPLKPGQAPPVYDKPFEFRRINGGWLLNSL